MDETKKQFDVIKEQFDIMMDCTTTLNNLKRSGNEMLAVLKLNKSIQETRSVFEQRLDST